MVFDISSSTNPIYTKGVDASGDNTGTGSAIIYSMTLSGTTLYIGKGNNATACSQVAGSAIGCELMGFTRSHLFDTELRGALTGTSALNNVAFNNSTTTISNSASTTNFTVASSGAVVPETTLSIAGNYTQSGTVQITQPVFFDGTGSQILSGALVGSNTFNDVTFRNAGTKTFSSNASTSSFTIESGSGAVIAPPGLTITGDYQNSSTFTHNSGELFFGGIPLTDLVGRDASGNSTGTENATIYSTVVFGSTLYIGKSNNLTACSQAVGSAIGCELMVFDISSSTNPIYTKGVDVFGSNTGTGNASIWSMTVSGNALYIGRDGGTTPCSQNPGSAIGCELMVFDISSSTNPIYTKGLDVSGSETGVGNEVVYSLAISGTALYIGKSSDATACSQVAGSAIGCELMVFDISSSTNPVYTKGLDVSGNTTGTGSLYIYSMAVSGSTLYIGKAANATACSQVAGSAIGCELMVFDISSSTNPVYTKGLDASGDNTGTGSSLINSMTLSGTSLYIGKAGSATACSQTPGSAIGCELMVFDISSSTNPIYTKGVDASGDNTGTGSSLIYSVTFSGNKLYIGKSGNGTACSQTPGSAIGCELMVFDISSSTNPIYAKGLDVSGSNTGTGNEYIYSMAISGNNLYIGKFGNATACSQTPGSAIGCELIQLRINPEVTGTLTGTSALNNISFNSGITTIIDTASTTNLTINPYVTLIAPSTTLSISGNYTNSGTFTHNSGTTTFIGTTAQTATGTMTGTSAFGNIMVTNTSATTTFGSTLTATSFIVPQGNSIIALPGSATTTITNTFTLTGTGGNTILLRSSQDGTQARLALGGEYSVTYANIKDMFATSTTGLINAYFATDVGNNNGWTFYSTMPLTLSGVLYSDEGATAFTVPHTIVIVVGTSTNTFNTMSNGSGVWSTTIDGIESSIPILMYVDATTTLRASLFTKASSTDNINNLNLYQNRVIVSHEGTSGTSTTISDMSFYDGDDDSDIQFTANYGALTINTGNELHINTGKTFAPGGTVYINGNAGSGTDGSLHVTTDAVYTPGGNTYIAGNLTASSSAVFTDSFHSFIFTATTTGKTVTAPTTALPSLAFTGTGTHTFTNTATTSNLNINTGATVVAPADTLAMQGNFQNNGTFTHNSGELNFNSSIIADLVGRDATGNNTGTGNAAIVSTAVSGNTLYIGKGGNGTACSQTPGSAIGCELMVFDISSSTNPIYTKGLDASGDSTGVGIENINSMAVSGNTLYIGKNSDATACSQVAGSAIGCELMVFDISSSTNPIYTKGLDASGDTTGIEGSIAINSMTLSGTTLYIGKGGHATACSQTAGSAIGCELMVFDISSSTNPIYTKGLDVSGSMTGAVGGVAIFSMTISGTTLYIGKSANSTACSQVAGSAIGCELMVFDVSSSTNPLYTKGLDVSGSMTGGGSISIYSITVSGTTLYIGKFAVATACSQTAGSAIGCELMVFDISSSTNPIYTKGLDASGDTTGTGSATVYFLVVSGTTLYIGKAGNATACSQTAGSAIGCELMVFDISSSTDPVYTKGLDASGNTTGTGNVQIYSMTLSGSALYVGKSNSTTACSQTAGSAIGCELMGFSRSHLFNNDIRGTLTESSALNNVVFNSTTTISNSASTTNFTVASSGVVVPEATLSISGNYTQSGAIQITQPVFFDGTSSQTLSGNMVEADGFNDVTFSNAGTKTFSSNASTSSFTIESGSGAVTAPPGLTIAGDYENNSTFTHNSGKLTFNSNSIADLLGRDASGDNTGTGNTPVQSMAVSGTTLYIGKSNNATACSQTAGSAIGCELMVFDISSSTNPRYTKGVDVTGNNTGTGNVLIYSMTISGSTLYIGKGGDATACSQVAGSALGCELMVFDISSSTNPIYTKGVDVTGDSTGTGSALIYSMTVSGSTLYIGKGGNAAACDQTPGSAIGCDLMVFDISSSTNPIYTKGVDASGDNTGTENSSIISMIFSGSTLYIGKSSSATACSQTPGSALGCEFMVFDISSSTNPIYTKGLDVTGNNTGTGSGVAAYSMTASGNTLYIGKSNNATACSQTPGSALGCELMVFDISSSTNPIYTKGLDVSGDNTGIGNALIYSMAISGTTLYIGKSNHPTACSQTAGSAIGCELMVFDISSSTNPVYTKGLDASGDMTGTGSVSIFSMTVSGSTLYIGKGGNATACSQTPGSAIGCELMRWRISSEVSGALTGSSALNNVVFSRGTTINNVASTTNLTIDTGATLVAPATTLSISGDYINNGTFTHNSGTTTFMGAIAQTATGTMTGTSAFGGIVVTNSSATTTFGSALTAVSFTVPQGNSIIALQGSATTTITGTFALAGSPRGNTVRLRSSQDDTQARLALGGGYSVTYANIKDIFATSTTGLINVYTSTDSGNNRGWTFVIAVALNSAENQIFGYGQGSTAMSPITIVDTGTITASNDIRIRIATSSANMLWDTTDTTATFTGSSSAKVGNPVSYEEGGSILVIPVSSDFAYGDTFTISDLSYTSFNAINIATTALGMRVDGVGTTTSVTDPQTIAIYGSLTLGDHTEGQVADNFVNTTESDTELYALRFTPGGESMDITALTFGLQGIQGITQDDLTNVRLYRDKNNNQAYDGEDVQVGGAPVVSIVDQTGTVAFSTIITASTTEDYLLVGDLANLKIHDALIVSLTNTDFTIVGTTTGNGIAFGSVVSIQHIRGGGGGGGGGGSGESHQAIGDPAPAGDGIQTGGGGGGGGEVDPNTDDTIGNEVGFNAPSSNGSPLGAWTSGANAYSSDGVYTTTSGVGAQHSYGNFGFSVPSDNQITGIAVKLESSGSTAAGTISVKLSWDGGTSVTSAQTTGTLGLTDGVYTLGGQGEMWGHSWVPSEMNDGTFTIELIANPSANTVRVDAIQSKAYYQAVGGGGGGGGAI